MKNTDVFVGVLSGLAVGALLGVLFAPDKGSNTRRKIDQKSTDVADNLKGSFSDFIASIEEQYSNFSEEANDAIEEGKSKIEHSLK
jgi:gas vesicle protein